MVLYHYTWKHSDRKTFSRLGICFGNDVRLLAITSALPLNVRAKLNKPKRISHQGPRQCTKPSMSGYYLFFFLIHRWPCMQKSLVLITCMFMDQWFDNFTSTKNEKQIVSWNSELTIFTKKDIVWVLLLSQFSWIKGIT